MIRRIEVDFALPVELTGAEHQALCRLVEGIARRHEPDDGVHWLAEVGDKPNLSAIDAAMLGVAPAPSEVRPADGEEPTFDATVLHLGTCARPFVSEAERARKLAKRARAATPPPASEPERAPAVEAPWKPRPADLVGAMHDRVHRDTGRSRPATIAAPVAAPTPGKCTVCGGDPDDRHDGPGHSTYRAPSPADVLRADVLAWADRYLVGKGHANARLYEILRAAAPASPEEPPLLTCNDCARFHGESRFTRCTNVTASYRECSLFELRASRKPGDGGASHG